MAREVSILIANSQICPIDRSRRNAIRDNWRPRDPANARNVGKGWLVREEPRLGNAGAGNGPSIVFQKRGQARHSKAGGTPGKGWTPRLGAAPCPKPAGPVDLHTTPRVRSQAASTCIPTYQSTSFRHYTISLSLDLLRRGSFSPLPGYSLPLSAFRAG